MLVSYDTEAGATYLRLSDHEVARTVEVSDLVMIDVDERDEPVGVDFAVAPQKITETMLLRVADRFPGLKELLETDTWLLTVSR